METNNGSHRDSRVMSLTTPTDPCGPSATLSYARENKLSLYLGALSHQKLSLCLQQSLRLHTTYPTVVIVLSRQWGQGVCLGVL